MHNVNAITRNNIVIKVLQYSKKFWSNILSSRLKSNDNTDQLFLVYTACFVDIAQCERLCNNISKDLWLQHLQNYLNRSVCSEVIVKTGSILGRLREGLRAILSASHV